MDGKLELVEPGMVLADAALDAAGHVLLPAGTVLTPAHLAALAERGVARLAVVPDAHGRARIDRLFRKLDPAHGDAWAAVALRASVTAWRKENAG